MLRPSNGGNRLTVSPVRKTLLVVAAVIPLAAIGAFAVVQAWGDETRRLGAIGAGDPPIALSWRGSWDSAAKYERGQVVSLHGASYVAETDVAEIQPSEKCGGDCPWTLLARPGRPGGTGPQGERGPAGPAGKPGAGTVRALQLPIQNDSATWQVLQDLPGVGRFEAWCVLSASGGTHVFWRYRNTTAEKRLMLSQRSSSAGNFAATVNPGDGRFTPGQTIPSSGHPFADQVTIFREDQPTATPYAEVFLGGTVLYDAASEPTSCPVRLIAATG